MDCNGDRCDIERCAGACRIACYANRTCRIKECRAGCFIGPPIGAETGGATLIIEDCTGGGCVIDCQAGDTCSIGPCAGGYCRILCAEGATCNCADSGCRVEVD